MDLGDIFWIGFLILTFFGGSITKVIKKYMPSQPATETDDSEEPMAEAEWTETEWAEPSETPRRVMEDDPWEESAETDNPYFTYDEVEPEVVEQPTQQSMSERIEEILRQQQFAQPKAKYEEDPLPVQSTENESDPLDEPFDLRKAIIYQTIMENNYR